MLLPSVCTSRPAFRYGPPTVLRDVSGWTVLRQTATAVPGHPASDAPYFPFFTWTYLCARVGIASRAYACTYTITEACCHLWLSLFRSYPHPSVTLGFSGRFLTGCAHDTATATLQSNSLFPLSLGSGSTLCAGIHGRMPPPTYAFLRSPLVQRTRASAPLAQWAHKNSVT